VTTTSPGPECQMIILRGYLFDLQSSDPNDLGILPLANIREESYSSHMAFYKSVSFQPRRPTV